MSTMNPAAFGQSFPSYNTDNQSLPQNAFAVQGQTAPNVMQNALQQQQQQQMTGGKCSSGEVVVAPGLMWMPWQALRQMRRPFRSPCRRRP